MSADETQIIYGSRFKRAWDANYGNLMDRIACRFGIWALRRLFGADCEIDVRKEFPGEDVECLSCDATRLVKSMREILQDV